MRSRGERKLSVLLRQASGGRNHCLLGSASPDERPCARPRHPWIRPIPPGSNRKARGCCGRITWPRPPKSSSASRRFCASSSRHKGGEGAQCLAVSAATVWRCCLVNNPAGWPNATYHHIHANSTRLLQDCMDIRFAPTLPTVAGRKHYPLCNCDAFHPAIRVLSGTISSTTTTRAPV